MPMRRSSRTRGCRCGFSTTGGFLESLHLPTSAAAKASVVVAETEGTVSAFGIDMGSGRVTTTPPGTGLEFRCPDRVWAAVATGHLRASEAYRLGLADGDAEAASVLDALAEGPPPFSHEYF